MDWITSVWKTSSSFNGWYLIMVKNKGLDTKISASIAFQHSPLNSVTPALLPPLHQNHSSICVIFKLLNTRYPLKSIKSTINCTIRIKLLLRMQERNLQFLNSWMDLEFFLSLWHDTERLVLETFCTSRMTEHRPVSVTTWTLPDWFTTDLKGSQTSAFVRETPTCVHRQKCDNFN